LAFAFLNLKFIIDNIILYKIKVFNNKVFNVWGCFMCKKFLSVLLLTILGTASFLNVNATSAVESVADKLVDTILHLPKEASENQISTFKDFAKFKEEFLKSKKLKEKMDSLLVFFDTVHRQTESKHRKRTFWVKSWADMTTVQLHNISICAVELCNKVSGVSNVVIVKKGEDLKYDLTFRMWANALRLFAIHVEAFRWYSSDHWWGLGWILGSSHVTVDFESVFSPYVVAGLIWASMDHDGHSDLDSAKSVMDVQCDAGDKVIKYVQTIVNMVQGFVVNNPSWLNESKRGIIQDFFISRHLERGALKVLVDVWRRNSDSKLIEKVPMSLSKWLCVHKLLLKSGEGCDLFGGDDVPEDSQALVDALTLLKNKLLELAKKLLLQKKKKSREDDDLGGAGCVLQ
jgi:hypothetical protein